MTEKNDYFMNIEVFNSDIFLHRKKKKQCPWGEKGFHWLLFLEYASGFGRILLKIKIKLKEKKWKRDCKEAPGIG